MQYDELTIERAGGTNKIIVFNRAIMLFKTNEEFFVRFHRVACLIDDTGRPNKRLQQAAGLPGEVDNIRELRPRRR
jgi:hypothetical protein